jgi:putative peptidoglycan binding protein
MLQSWLFFANDALQRAANNSPPLARGSQGDAVRCLQLGLCALGYSMPVSVKPKPLSADGIFGQETDAAVRLFQQRQAWRRWNRGPANLVAARPAPADGQGPAVRRHERPRTLWTAHGEGRGKRAGAAIGVRTKARRGGPVGAGEPAEARPSSEEPALRIGDGRGLIDQVAQGDQTMNVACTRRDLST